MLPLSEEVLFFLFGLKGGKSSMSLSTSSLHFFVGNSNLVISCVEGVLFCFFRLNDGRSSGIGIIVFSQSAVELNVEVTDRCGIFSRYPSIFYVHLSLLNCPP